MTDSGFTFDPDAIPDPDAISPDKVVVVAFSDDGKAYEALATVKQLDRDGQIDLVEAAVVTRDQDGRVHLKDEAGDHSLEGTASGGLIGLLIGILGGPLGVLLGGATGLLFDSCTTSTTPTPPSPRSARSPRASRWDATPSWPRSSSRVPRYSTRRWHNWRPRPAPPGLRDRGRDRPCAGGPARRKNQANAKLREARHEKTRAQARAKVEELKSKLHPERKRATTGS